MKVRTPKGEQYRIGRRWVPWRRRTSKALDFVGADAFADGPGDDPITFVLGATVLIPILLVLAVVVGECLLLLPFFVLARSIFGTPWVLEVTHRREVVHAEEVEGWGASQQRINQLVTATGRGELPPGVEQHVRDKVRKSRPRRGRRPGTKPGGSPGHRSRPGDRSSLGPRAGLRSSPRFRTSHGLRWSPRFRTPHGLTTRPS